MSVQQPAAEGESSVYFFSSRELARLAVYRAAVIACFYSDECEPVKIRAAQDPLQRLREATPTAA